MKKILHKLKYAQNPSQYEAHPSYYEEILCKVLTVNLSYLSLCSFIRFMGREVAAALRRCGVGREVRVTHSVQYVRVVCGVVDALNHKLH